MKFRNVCGDTLKKIQICLHIFYYRITAAGVNIAMSAVESNCDSDYLIVSYFIPHESLQMQ